ncbi:MAG: hypothetical protein WAV48_04565 [Candidatus Magasanikiibacteriota bacterium]
MAIPNEQVREQIRTLILAGEKNAAIQAKFAGQCEYKDIVNIKTRLKAEGLIVGKTPSVAIKDGGSNGKKYKKGTDEFQFAVVKEIKQVSSDIERMNRLAEVYDSKNSEFAAFLETKIQKETKKLTMLQDFQKQ